MDVDIYVNVTKKYSLLVFLFCFVLVGGQGLGAVLG